MAKKTSSDSTEITRRPARTAKARENQLINLAINLAEKQLREGTASSQVISHYLRLASTRNDLEKEHLRKKNELLDAQIDSIKSYKNIEALFKAAVDAHSVYLGEKTDDFENI